MDAVKKQMASDLERVKSAAEAAAKQASTTAAVVHHKVSAGSITIPTEGRWVHRSGTVAAIHNTDDYKALMIVGANFGGKRYNRPYGRHIRMWDTVEVEGELINSSQTIKPGPAWFHREGKDASIHNEPHSYKALMIVGGNHSTGYGRHVRMWDSVTVEGSLYLRGKFQFNTSKDRWLRLFGDNDSRDKFYGAFGAKEFWSYRFHTASDRRLKTNIKTMSNAQILLTRLRGVYFNWKTKNGGYAKRQSMGFIAQEVQKVVPEVVAHGADGHLAVDYARLTALLVEGHKDAAKERETLAVSVEHLRKELASTQKELKLTTLQLAAMRRSVLATTATESSPSASEGANDDGDGVAANASASDGEDAEDDMEAEE
jgi:hypothetical protein